MARLRRVVTWTLFAGVVFTLGFAAGKEVGARRALASLPTQAPATASTATPAGEGESPSHQIAAWYYHSTKRCQKCNTIEAYAKEALDTLFAAQMADGTITWQTANMDDVWNQDAVRRYGLLQSSLVLVDLRDGVEQDYMVLNRTWDLTDDKPLFLAYVESEVEMMLDGWEADDEGEE